MVGGPLAGHGLFSERKQPISGCWKEVSRDPKRGITPPKYSELVCLAPGIVPRRPGCPSRPALGVALGRCPVLPLLFSLHPLPQPSTWLWVLYWVVSTLHTLSQLTPAWGGVCPLCRWENGGAEGACACGSCGVVGTAPCLGQSCSEVHPVPKFMSAIRKDLGPLGAQ